MTRRTLPIALVFFAASASAEQRWLKATSTNFEVYTTAGEKKARDVVLNFEQVHGFFAKAVHATHSAKGRVRIVAFQSSKEYKPYQINQNAMAYAGGGADRDEIVMGGVSSEYYPVAIHEYVHILLKPARNMPLWLNEGLAELYSSLHQSGKKVVVGDVLPGRIELLNQNKWIDLPTLCTVDTSSPLYTADHTKVSVFYAESWLLTHMLFLGDSYRPKFREFFGLVLAGTDAKEAFQKAFSKQMPEVFADLRKYSQAGTFRQPLFDVTLEKSAEDPEIKPVTPFEAGLVLASVLADINRMDEARQAYVKLAAENPASPEVAEALGYLAWRRQESQEARAQFAKAVNLGSKNAHMYYDYCAMAGGAGEPIERQISLLQKALDIDPEFDDARLHLGYLLLSNSDYKGALAQFSHLKKVEPEQAFQFFHAVAYADYRTGDKEGARTSAKRAAELAKDSAEKAEIEQLQTAIEERPRERLRAVEPAPEQRATAEPPPTSEPPRDQRPAPVSKALIVRRQPLTAVEGTLDQIDCLGTTARLRMTTAGSAARLLIDKPNGIEIRGAQAGTFTLTCGPQKPRRTVRVEYEPKVSSELGTIGLVRVMEMK